MHFNVVVTNCGVQSKVAIINSQLPPNKGDEIEIVKGKTTEKFKVTGVTRKYVSSTNDMWNTFITVDVVKYD